MKIFIALTANWIDVSTFQRKTVALACDILKPSSSFEETLDQRLQAIYSQFNLEGKIVATASHNSIYLNVDQHECSKYDKIRDLPQTKQLTYIKINDLDNHIQCSAYYFEKICIVDAAKKMVDATQISAFDKFHRFTEIAPNDFDETSDQNNSDSKCTFNFNAISKWLDRDETQLREIEMDKPLMLESNEKEFLREYITVIEPIATAIEYQQKNDCFFAAYLPMVHSTRNHLVELKNSEQIQWCNSQLNAIVEGIETRFAHLFDFHDKKCVIPLIATCSHPFFKMRWLKGELKTSSNVNFIVDVLIKAAKEIKTEEKTDTNDTSSTQNKGKILVFFLELKGAYR